MPTAVAVDRNARPTVGGAAGQLEGFLRTLIADLVESRNDYLNSLTSIGWDRILDGDRLKADVGMRDSLNMLAQAEANLIAHEAQYRAIAGSMRSRIDALDISRAEKDAMFAGAKKSMDANAGQVDEQFRLEHATIDEFRSIIELLAHVPWELENGQAMFYSDADVAAFNAHMQRIDENTARQQQLQTQSKARLDANVEKMKSMVQ